MERDTAVTMQKKVILQALEDAGRTHPTAETIYSLAKKRLPRISMGTVYRNLSDMSAKGEIIRIPVTDGPDRFDKEISRHDHAVCKVCGRLFDLAPGVVYIPDACKPRGCRLLDTHLLLQCICAECEESTLAGI